MKSDDFLKSEDVSRMLGIGESTVQTMAKKGDIPSVMFSQRCRRFYKPDVEQWLARRISRSDQASSRFFQPSDRSDNGMAGGELQKMISDEVRKVLKEFLG